jgi:hypothetical protein
VRFFFSFFLSVSAVAVATVLSVFKLAATIAPAFCFVLFFFFFARSLCVFRLAAPHLSFYGPPLRFPSLRTQEPALVSISRALTKCHRIEEAGGCIVWTHNYQEYIIMTGVYSSSIVTKSWWWREPSARGDKMRK